MPTVLGDHSPRLAEVRALANRRGRSEQRRFAFEGPTMLAEARRSGLEPEAVYATQAGFTSYAEVLAPLSAPVFLIGDRAMARISAVDTPSGLLAVTPAKLAPLDSLLASGDPVLLLAGVGDPGNAGTLLRSAEAFGIGRTIFGSGAVDPYNPKVVRGSMGSIFRMKLAVDEPGEVVRAARKYGYALIASGRDGSELRGFKFAQRSIIAIGSERHGVAAWLPESDATVAIPQAGPVESLNAAVAGSIVLYEFALSRGLSTRQEP